MAEANENKKLISYANFQGSSNLTTDIEGFRIKGIVPTEYIADNADLSMSFHLPDDNDTTGFNSNERPSMRIINGITDVSSGSMMVI